MRPYVIAHVTHVLKTPLLDHSIEFFFLAFLLIRLFYFNINLLKMNIIFIKTKIKSNFYSISYILLNYFCKISSTTVALSI
jgi:hypothetical protein